MKKILITGANGFIGSSLTDEAIEQGYEVFAGVRKTSNRRFLANKPLQFFELDYTSPVSLHESFNAFKNESGGFDYIIHNAGITQAKKKEDFFTVNFQYTKTLADAVISSGMNIQKMVYISSLATYGPGDEKTMLPIHTLQNREPVSEYGKSKLMAEEYLRALTDLPSVIIQPTAVYGPRDKDFLQFVRLVNNGLEPYIGRHRQMISLVYVKDLARAVLRLTSSSFVGGSYIVSDENEYSKEELGAAIKNILNKKTLKFKLPLMPVKLAVSGVSKLSEVLFQSLPFLNTEKLHEISRANWMCTSNVWEQIQEKPSFDLHNGMAETIQWYRENRWL